MSITLTYNGKSTADFVKNRAAWLHVASRPVIPKGVEDIESIRIPGRDGALIIRNGSYAPIDISVEFSFKIPSGYSYDDCFKEVAGWLKNDVGSTVVANPYLKFSYLENYYKVLNVQIGDITFLTQHIGRMTVVFTCEAFPYEDPTVTMGPYSMNSSSDYISENVQLATCHPLFLLNVTSYGTLYLYRAGVVALTLAIPSTGSYYVDSDLMVTYKLSNMTKTNMSYIVTGNYSDLWYGLTVRGETVHRYRISAPSSGGASATLTIYPRRRYRQ